MPLLTFKHVHFAEFHFHHSVFLQNTGLGTNILFAKKSYIVRSLVKKKSIPDWRLFITQMETKWTKWYAMTSHVIAYRLLELLFSTHTFHFNCFFEDFNCVFTQIRCLSRVLGLNKLPFDFVKIPPPSQNLPQVKQIQFCHQAKYDRFISQSCSNTTPGLQIYGGPGSLSHDFKIWPIAFQGSGPSGPILFSCEKISL